MYVIDVVLIFLGKIWMLDCIPSHRRWKSNIQMWKCYEMAVAYSVVLGHGSNPNSDICNITEYEKILLRQLSVSRFQAKLLRVNKITMKSFSKKKKKYLSFEVDFTLNIIGMRSYVGIQSGRVVIWHYYLQVKNVHVFWIDFL